MLYCNWCYKYFAALPLVPCCDALALTNVSQLCCFRTVGGTVGASNVLRFAAGALLCCYCCYQCFVALSLISNEYQLFGEVDAAHLKICRKLCHFRLKSVLPQMNQKQHQPLLPEFFTDGLQCPVNLFPNRFN